MIYTAQLFFNELDLLEIKCRELDGIVDRHILVESPLTFTGLPKPLHFQQNAGRFAQWPITAAVAPLPASANSPWDREWAQHKFLRDFMRIIAKAGDIVLWLDCDECPRADVVDRFRAMGVPAAMVDMDKLLFFFDRLDPTHPRGDPHNTTARIGTYDPAAEWGPWRGDELAGKVFIPDCGWHFEYFGQKETLLAKLAATSHSVEDPFQTMARDVAGGHHPGLERTVPYPPEKLPACIRENPARYAKWFSRPNINAA